MAVSSFPYGAQRGPIPTTLTITATTISDTTVSSGTAYATVQIGSDGNVYEDTRNGGSAQINATADWCRPGHRASLNYVYASANPLLDAPTSGPTLSQWHTGDASRTWGLTAISADLQCQLRISLSNDAASVSSEAVITLEANASGT